MTERNYSKNPANIIPKRRVIPSEVKSAIRKLAEQPTDGDPVVGAFYQAVEAKVNTVERYGEEYRVGTGDRFVETLMEVVEDRLSRSSADFIAKFLFQAYQYTFWYLHDYQANLETPQLFTSEPFYNKFNTQRQWEWQLDEDFSVSRRSGRLSNFRRIWMETMKTDTIPTTIAQRYAGVKAVLAQRFGNQPMVVADIGCGTNIGLKMLETHTPFEPIEDHTGGIVNMLLDQRLDIDKGIGIDIQDFTQSHARLLAKACRYTPSEFWRISIDMAQEEFINSRSNKAKIEFRQGDFLVDGALLPEKADAIILSTILYQLKGQEERLQFIEKALSHLNDKGILIIQDFAKKVPFSDTNPFGLEFGQYWNRYVTYVMYKTRFPVNKVGMVENIIGPLELLIWSGGRCREVKEGADFNRYFETDYSNSESAAFAH